jgi:exodeoxyribonuclease VII large subunit
MNYTVSDLNNYVKEILSYDYTLINATVTGEVSGVKMHSSGHIYFTLKDESASVKCAFFKPYSLKWRFKLKDGMKVSVKGKITLYERDGQFQINVTELEEDGLGALYIKLEELKKKLSNEGLFDEKYKKKIPQYVKRIGVVTSPTGAVFRDIVNVATRRCPDIQIMLAPVKVQGEEAPRSICTGIRVLDAISDIDVIIVGRGGGSFEELYCFNDEDVARTIFNCKKPVISAVGHETDYTIADFVADLRAPTPSAAAELAVFDYHDTLLDIDYFEKNSLIFDVMYCSCSSSNSVCIGKDKTSSDNFSEISNVLP